MLPPLWGNDNIPKIFVDSHTKRAELRESYQLEDRSVGKAFIFVSVAQFLRCGDEALLTVREKWVRASARKKAFGSRLRQAKCSACPTQGWVTSLPHHRRILSALRGNVARFLMLFFRRLRSAPKNGPKPPKSPGRGTRRGNLGKPHTPAHKGQEPGKLLMTQSLIFLCTACQCWRLPTFYYILSYFAH